MAETVRIAHLDWERSRISFRVTTYGDVNVVPRAMSVNRADARKRVLAARSGHASDSSSEH